MKTLTALLLLALGTAACGSSHDVPETALGYSCNQVTSGGPSIIYACSQAATGEVCKVVAAAETGVRLFSNCAEYN